MTLKEVTVAMRIGLTMLCGIGAVVSVVAAGNEAWLAPARAVRRQNPVPANEESISAGRALYIGACVPCHGSKGRGDGPAAVYLERHPGVLSDPRMWQQTDGALFWKITEGNSPMPSFRDAFSDAQRWEIVDYVRTLATKSANQLAGATNLSKVRPTVRRTERPQPR